jgi:hypothetical protein
MAEADAVAKAALEVLLATKLEQQAAVSDQLVREIYETEVRLQYDEARAPAVAAIRKAVEAEVDREITAEQGDE